jgi:hypothetical protein
MCGRVNVREGQSWYHVNYKCEYVMLFKTSFEYVPS